jgi:hypothetical protein
MSDFEIMHRITIPERGEPSRSDAFEEFMRDEYFPAVSGEVTGLRLLGGVRGHIPTNTSLLHVSFGGFADGGAVVDEETELYPIAPVRRNYPQRDHDTSERYYRFLMYYGAQCACSVHKKMLSHRTKTQPRENRKSRAAVPRRG